MILSVYDATALKVNGAKKAILLYISKHSTSIGTQQVNKQVIASWLLLTMQQIAVLSSINDGTELGPTNQDICIHVTSDILE